MLDCFVAEPVIGPRLARSRWLLAMAVCASLSRGAVCRDDLIGRAPRHFRHTIELPREAARARGGRAQLHDQFTDFGLGHHRADPIPTRPAFAGIEAENLAPPPR